MNLQKQSQDTIHKCSICGRPYKDKIMEFSGRTYHYSIPECDCEEKLRRREDNKKKGQNIKTRILQIKDCGVGKRFKDRTFSNFDKKINNKAYQVCLNYAKHYFDYEREGKGLFLSGPVGTGKTHLAVAIIDYIARIHKRKFEGKIIFTTSVNLLSSIRLGYKTNSAEKICRECESCQLLVIDDLGSEKITDWVGEIFYRIIDNRYSELKPIIITSNYSLTELKEKIGERLVSRIYDMCEGVKFEGKDWRLIKTSK